MGGKTPGCRGNLGEHAVGSFSSMSGGGPAVTCPDHSPWPPSRISTGRVCRPASPGPAMPHSYGARGSRARSFFKSLESEHGTCAFQFTTVLAPPDDLLWMCPYGPARPLWAYRSVAPIFLVSGFKLGFPSGIRNTAWAAVLKAPPDDSRMQQDLRTAATGWRALTSRRFPLLISKWTGSLYPRLGHLGQ